MKITAIDQSYTDGDFYLLNISETNILIGSPFKQSSILKYLPAYFDFKDDEEKEKEEESPKHSKRQKVIDKQEKYSQLLKPLNIMDCDFEQVPDPDLRSNFANKLNIDGNKEKLYKKINSEYFIDQAPTKYQLRNLNICDIKDLEIVLVSQFNDLYGLPFITRLPEFKGKVYMTQPLAQIGYHLVMEFVNQNSNRNTKKDTISSFFKQEKLHEIFAKEGIEEWQDLYTAEDVDNYFNNHVTVLNFNELCHFNNFITLTPLSSGFHIGSCNWLVEVGQYRVGIVRNSSEEGDFRHPLYLNTDALLNLDVLLLGTIARPLSHEKKKDTVNMQLKVFVDKLITCQQGSFNSKVLLPISSNFILDIVDILMMKTQQRIIFISESANQIIQYSNINIEYLNEMIQKKIYQNETPFNFDKLIQQDRLMVFKDMQQYIEFRKANGYAEEFQSEIIITSQSNLRIGESVYWLHNLNKHHKQEGSLILTDYLYAQNEMLLKPFKGMNNIKTFHTPIDPNLTMNQINSIINKIQPKRVVVPSQYQSNDNTSNTIMIDCQSVIETIEIGQTLILSEDQIGTLKYNGICPVNLANMIKQKQKGQTKISRIHGIDITFKDKKYEITNIDKKNDQKSKPKLFFKLLELRNPNISKQMIQISQQVPIEQSLNQIKVILLQQGYKNQSETKNGLSTIYLDEYDCKIVINGYNRQINIESCENYNLLRTMSELIKKILKLI